MANRAYLYFSDELTQGITREGDDYRKGDDYYDSRWNIPITWWLFFVEDNVKRFQIKESYGVFEQLLICEEWHLAKIRFKERLSEFSECLPIEIKHLDFKMFLDDLERKSRKYLIFDPEEVIEDGVYAINEIVMLIRSIDDQTLNRKERFDKINKYTWLSAEPEYLVLHTIGVTYS